MVFGVISLQSPELRPHNQVQLSVNAQDTRFEGDGSYSFVEDTTYPMLSRLVSLIMGVFNFGMMLIYIYIYTYMEREIEREREGEGEMYLYIRGSVI